MGRLLERGRESRIDVIAKLKPAPRTEAELEMEAGLSRSTIRSIIRLLAEKGYLASQRRKKSGPGAGPIEYRLTSPESAEWIERSLHEPATAPRRAQPPAGHEGTRASSAGVGAGRVFVIVKRGTNDAVLTKDGRMLRAEPGAVEETLAHYQKVLRGTRLEPLTIETYFAKYYPELGGKLPTDIL